MSAVFREVSLAWDGKAYSVKPTMQLLNKIENRISLAVLVNHTIKDAPKWSWWAIVLFEFFKEAGVNVSEEEVYGEFIQSDLASRYELINSLILAIYPAPKKKENMTA